MTGETLGAHDTMELKSALEQAAAVFHRVEESIHDVKAGSAAKAAAAAQRQKEYETREIERMLRHGSGEHVHKGHVRGAAQQRERDAPRRAAPTKTPSQSALEDVQKKLDEVQKKLRASGIRMAPPEKRAFRP